MYGFINNETVSFKEMCHLSENTIKLLQGKCCLM